MSDFLLDARGLGKTYVLGGKPLSVLHGASLSLAPGSYATIRGASGSGKSTLLQILGGLQRPDEGEVRWRGKVLGDYSRARLAEWRNRHVGFVFQSYHLLPEFSALENVEMPALLRGKGDPKRGRALLERVGLGDRADHRPAELSGGEQQRVAVARALRNDPDLILADEPTGNLDHETGAQIVALLEALPTEGKTVVLVTHDPEIASRGQHRLEVHGGHLDAVA
jgi:ABC-type lipoprotein export system ATPase subunit